MKRYPSRVGEACWDPTRVAKAISLVAQVSKERSNYFLASHAPIRDLRDTKSQRTLTEADLFQSLFDRSREGVLAAIVGDPGTGKSHLIQWLRLRCEHAIETGELAQVRTVLIERRNGSLRDALQQLIEQLGEEFQEYLTPIKNAVQTISDGSARELLATKLYMELGALWTEKGRAPRTGYLKNLQETCADRGFRTWLCRDSGAIHRNVERLIAASDVGERQDLPEFSGDDFLPEPKFRKDVTPHVSNLIDEFIDSPELRAQAAGHFNEVLPAALQQMSGLTATQLQAVFDSVRRELRKNDESLALFIEDISVAHGLDKEILNALEPQPRPDLCPLVAVVGMTNTGEGRLATNERERITHLVSIAGAVGAWQSNTEGIAAFTARYLNSLRMSEHEVSSVATERRNGSDVGTSHCAGCPVESDCHKTFGAVNIGAVKVGMFPLTKDAPAQLLAALDGSADVRKNPRGFLEHVLRVLVADSEALQSGRFPQLAVVRPPEPTYWLAFRGKYCANWSENDIRRLKLLAQAWIKATDTESAASKLTPLLKPLGLPGFSSAAAVAPKHSLKVVPDGGQVGQDLSSKRTSLTTEASEDRDQAPTPREVVRTIPTGLQPLLDNLTSWHEGGPLDKDIEPRGIFLKFVQNSVPFLEQREFSQTAFLLAYKDAGQIAFDDQRSKSANRATTWTINRNAENYELMVALANHSAYGGSWSFPNGEHHKRVAFRWLRRNSRALLAATSPTPDAPNQAIVSAVAILYVAALIRVGGPLPRRPAELVAELFADFACPPRHKSPLMEHFGRDLQEAHDGVRRFLLDELGVKQGDRGKPNLVSPIAISAALKRFPRELSELKKPTAETFEGVGARRFAAIPPKLIDSLPAAVQSEVNAIRERMNIVRSVLAEFVGAGSDMPKSLAEFSAEFRALCGAMRTAKFAIPAPEFRLDDLRAFHDSTGGGAKAIAHASAVLLDPTPETVLPMETGELDRIASIMTDTHRYLAKVEEEVSLLEMRAGNAVALPLTEQRLTEALRVIAEATT